MTGAYLTRDLHVAASDRECIRHVQRKLRPSARYDRTCRAARHQAYRDALDAHHAHQRLVDDFHLNPTPPMAA